ncbi:MAG: RsmD family RNA methyltransferase, partial [Pseudomonadota bacterium]
FFKTLVNGATVLDVFSLVGGFGRAARAAGAAAVTCVDSSVPALDLAQRGADATDGAGTFACVKSDAFGALQDFGADGQSFDCVVCDPPAFAPSKQALEPGLRAYERVARLAAPLVSQDGILVLCSCSHAATLEKFRAACVRGIGRSGRSAQLIHTGEAGPDHPKHIMLAETGYLKSLFFRVF